MNDDLLQLEFVGGPFDGHIQDFPSHREQLAPTVGLPVNENVFRMLDGKVRGRAAPSRTIAIYALCRGESGYQYRFIGARRAVELNLESWKV